jgi:hypothetical protein
VEALGDGLHDRESVGCVADDVAVLIDRRPGTPPDAREHV